MAIAIEGCTVVALKSRISEKYEGGLDTLSQSAPNRTVLADDDLWRCSFMTSADAEKFLEELHNAGLNVRQGPDPDAVIVDESELSASPYCEWLQVAQWEKGVIGWRVGTTPRKVVAHQGWSPEHGSGLQFVTPETEEHLELLRYEGNVAVYFDKQRGKEVYIGRSAPDPNEVFRLASRVILDNCFNTNEEELSDVVRTKIIEAIADLEKIAEQFPDQWRPLFFIGKGYSAIDELDFAYKSLRLAYELETENEAVPRELSGVCLELGKAEEAVQIAQKAAALKPDNPQTLGNLACAYLIAGRLHEADVTIRATLTLDPSDEINLRLHSVIREVCAGQRPQPRHIHDLTKPAVRTNDIPLPPTQIKKSGFWSRFRHWLHRR